VRPNDGRLTRTLLCHSLMSIPSSEDAAVSLEDEVGRLDLDESQENRLRAEGVGDVAPATFVVELLRWGDGRGGCSSFVDACRTRGVEATESIEVEGGTMDGLAFLSLRVWSGRGRGSALDRQDMRRITFARGLRTGLPTATCGGEAGKSGLWARAICARNAL
jgi:hypothetical protein